MLKIHILGGSGSGKTTLAERIAARFHVSHHDLDKLGWKYGTNGIAYIEDAFAIADQPGWVTEGIYLIWVDPLLYQADYIVLLEVSWSVAAWRIIRRHIIKSIRGINPYSTRLLFGFLKNTHDYIVNRCTAERADVMRVYLEVHGATIEPPVADLLLMRLEQYWGGIPPTAEFVHRYLEKYKEKVIVVRNNADRDRLLAMLAEKAL
jgi:adenylate kinase family enzyme